MAETTEGQQRWLTEGSTVWTWATADPVFVMKDNIEALRLALYLDAKERQLEETKAALRRCVKEFDRWNQHDGTALTLAAAAEDAREFLSRLDPKAEG
jgi:hypothetical protein